MRARRSVSCLVYGLLGVVAISVYLCFEEENCCLSPHCVAKKFALANDQLNPMIARNLVPRLQNKSRTLVLVYTKFSKIERWINERGSCYNLNHTISKECPLDKFKVTYDKQRFPESDFVVFHARDMPTLRHLKTLLKERPMSQRWVFALWESPNHFSYTKPFHGLFNLTWTYRRDSDIWAPYGSYIQIRTDKTKRPLSDFTRGKTKFVAWMVSNCGATLRINFVRELKKFIKVDVFGNCSGKIFGQSRSCPKTEQSNFDHCLKEYKFYLSFENALCEDYITEKYWANLGGAHVVPVVMGGADYSKLAIPGSYINVMDFKTVKELADYLQYLDENDTAYNEYFKWRKEYKVLSGIGRTLCNICQWFASNFSHGTKVYNDLTEYWVKKAKCDTKSDLVASMITD